jgi:hypothetical protein
MDLLSSLPSNAFIPRKHFRKTLPQMIHFRKDFRLKDLGIEV